MALVIPHPEAIPDQLGNSLQGPQFGGIASGGRPGQQCLLQLAQLLGRQARLGTGRPPTRQSNLALLPPAMIPAIHTGWGHLQLTGYFHLCDSYCEKPGSLQPPHLHGGQISPRLAAMFAHTSMLTHQ